MCGLMSKRIQRQRSSRVDLQFDNYRVKWLIYNAASPAAFAESIVASQDHTRKRGWNQKQIQSKGRYEEIFASLGTGNTFSAAVNGKFHVQISLSLGCQS